MPYHLDVPSALALPLNVSAADGNPHVTFEDLNRAKMILQWVDDQLNRITPPNVSVHCDVELMSYGHLEIRAEVSDSGLWNSVDWIVQTAKRASHGCCENCDKPGGIAFESGWLTALCDRCCEERVADRVNNGFKPGERYDFAA